MPPVLVTGASGFLGGRLTEMLAERAASPVVRILVRSSSDVRRLSSLPIEIIRGELTDPECARRAMDGVANVYHCAAASLDWAPWSVYREANIAAVECLLSAAARTPALQRFIHVSTTDIYGYPHTPCAEDYPLTDVGLPYNSTKCAGEQAVWKAHAEHGVPVTIVRPATIIGPGSKDFGRELAGLLASRVMIHLGGGRMPGGFCHVDHVADAMIAAAATPAACGRAYNLCDESGVTWKEYVDGLAEALGYPRPRLSIPAGAAFAIARVLEALYSACRITSRPLLTRHAVRLFTRNQDFPSGRARRDLNWRPSIPVDQAIRQTARWLRESCSTSTAVD